MSVDEDLRTLERLLREGDPTIAGRFVRASARAGHDLWQMFRTYLDLTLQNPFDECHREMLLQVCLAMPIDTFDGPRVNARRFVLDRTTNSTFEEGNYGIVRAGTYPSGILCGSTNIVVVDSTFTGRSQHFGTLSRAKNFIIFGGTFEEDYALRSAENGIIYRADFKGKHSLLNARRMLKCDGRNYISSSFSYPMIFKLRLNPAA